VNGICEALFGPLAGIECRRALGRGWVLVARGIALVPPALVVLGALWTWWFWGRFSRNFAPQDALTIALMLLEGMLLTVALVLTPALLAGTLAGEKGRSTLIVLLTTRVAAGDIVVARLVGQLCVIGILLLAGLPALAFLAALRGLTLGTLGVLILLPAAVAFGGGGLAVAASAVARRARDALLLIYLVDLLFLLAPVLVGGVSMSVQEWLGPLNPYQAIDPLIAWEVPWPALLTVGLWTSLGLAGTAAAAWRLRIDYLRDADNRPSRCRLYRRRVPPVSDRPLLWKERYIEQVQAFSRLVYWLGLLVVVAYVGASIALAVMVAWRPSTLAGVDWADWAKAQMSTWAEASKPISWLVQWSLGLRAAAAIASERQRGTWDILLVTPLEGRDLVTAKILGGIHGLRAFVAAVFLAWTLGLLSGALSVADYVTLVGNTIAAGVFMVIMGIAFSLYCASVTRAMTFVIISWLTAAACTAALGGLLAAGLVIAIVWFLWSFVTDGFVPGTLPGGSAFSDWLSVAYVIGRWSLYVFASLIVAGYCRRSFDRLAGRSFVHATRRHKRVLLPRAQRPAVTSKSLIHE
jgi:ABC-type transport system involved in multi-copper enzyme maturation permease subunit